MIEPFPKPPSSIHKPARLSRRKPVTIAACFEFDDGILFCADTKITADVKTNQTKIFPNDYTGPGSYCATVFVIAGSVPYAKAAIRECEKRIAKLDFLQT